MALTTAERIKQVFNLEALRDEAKAQLTGRQWEQRKALVDRCKKACWKAEGLNYKRYPVRVEVASKKLIDEAASKTKEHKPFWAQNDRFDKAAVLRLAQREARQGHERRVAQINQYETRGLSNLLASAKRENQLQGKSERAFNRVADRQRSDGLPQSRTRKRQR